MDGYTVSYVQSQKVEYSQMVTVANIKFNNLSCLDFQIYLLESPMHANLLKLYSIEVKDLPYINTLRL